MRQPLTASNSQWQVTWERKFVIFKVSFVSADSWLFQNATGFACKTLGASWCRQIADIQATGSKLTMDRVKKIFIAATVGLFILTLLNSCHKYPEDPFLSLRRPGHRLESGTGTTWKFTSYQIYGQEHSHDFDSLLNSHTLIGCTLIFYNDHDILECSMSYDNSFSNRIVSGNYYITNDNKRLSIYANVSANPTHDIFVNLFKPTQISSTLWRFPEWTIVELYGKKLHISNNGIDIYFKKQ